MQNLLHVIRTHLFTFIYIVLVAIMPLICSSGIVFALTKYYWFFQDLHPVDIAIVFLVLSFTTAFAMTPTTFICFLSGFLWGWISLVYILPTYLLSQTIGFRLAKLIDGNRLVVSLEKMGKVPVFLKSISTNQLKIVFLCRLSPVLPFALMNVLLSVLQINFKKFLWGGLLGMLPRTLFVLWLGTQAGSIINGTGENLYYKIGFVVLTALTVFGLGKILIRTSKEVGH